MGQVDRVCTGPAPTMWWNWGAGSRSRVASWRVWNWENVANLLRPFHQPNHRCSKMRRSAAAAFGKSRTHPPPADTRHRTTRRWRCPVLQFLRGVPSGHIHPPTFPRQGALPTCTDNGPDQPGVRVMILLFSISVSYFLAYFFFY